MNISQQALIEMALKAREQAYVPYSHYPVGAALLTKSGTVYTGCNIENAAYAETICAERVAVFKAVSEGETEFSAIAVVTRDAGSPCGACRQVLNEFSPDMTVIIADEHGVVLPKGGISTAEQLLPYHFGPDNLKTE